MIERESILEKEINELLQVERELDKTSQLIRQAQGERSHLLEQWEDTANFLNSNQRDIQNTVEVSTYSIVLCKIKTTCINIFIKINYDNLN